MKLSPTIRLCLATTLALYLVLTMHIQKDSANRSGNLQLDLIMDTDRDAHQFAALIASAARQMLKGFGCENGSCTYTTAGAELLDPRSIIPGTNLSLRETKSLLHSDFDIPSQSDICSALAGKTVLIIGPETTYHLYTLLLSAVQVRRLTPPSGVGPLFHTFYHICQRKASENGRYHYVAQPTHQELIDTGSSVLRYALSSALYDGSSPDDLVYNGSVVDSTTGVRMREVWWKAKAGKADVVVLNRGPEPAPVWTYDGTDTGNWTWLDELGSGSSVRGHEDSRNLKIIKAASHVIATRYLPSLLTTLSSLRSTRRTKETLIFWHDGWYAERGNTPRPWSEVEVMQESVADPWTLYYNSQMMIHKRILPYILGCYGVVYLPVIQRPSPLAEQEGHDNELRRPTYLFTSDSVQGREILRNILGGIVRILGRATD